MSNTPVIINILALNGGLRTTFYDFSAGLSATMGITYKYQVDENVAFSFIPDLENNDHNKSVTIVGLTNGTTYLIKIISTIGATTYTSVAVNGTPYDFPTSTLTATAQNSATQIDFTYAMQQTNGKDVLDTQYSVNNGAYNAFVGSPFTYSEVGITLGMPYTFNVLTNLTSEDIRIRDCSFNEDLSRLTTTHLYVDDNPFNGWFKTATGDGGATVINAINSPFISTPPPSPNSLALQVASSSSAIYINQSLFLYPSNYIFSLYCLARQSIFYVSSHILELSANGVSAQWAGLNATNLSQSEWRKKSLSFTVTVAGHYNLQIGSINQEGGDSAINVAEVTLTKYNFQSTSITKTVYPPPNQITTIAAILAIGKIHIQFTPPYSELPITSYKYKIDNDSYNVLQTYTTDSYGNISFFLKDGLLLSVEYTIYVVATSDAGDSIDSIGVTASYDTGITHVVPSSLEYTFTATMPTPLNAVTFDGTTINFSPTTRQISSISKNPNLGDVRLQTTISPNLAPEIIGSFVENNTSTVQFSQNGYNTKDTYTLNFSKNGTDWKQITNVKNI